MLTLRDLLPRSVRPMARRLKRLVVSPPREPRAPVIESAAADSDIDYQREYKQADLAQNYWHIVGPRTREEYDRLAGVKLQQLIALGLTPGSRLLDVGCGTGQLAQACESFLAADGLYFGTDVGPEGVAFCERRFRRPNFRFAVNEATTLPIRDRTFDAACFFSVFTHTYLHETTLLLAETERLLAPGGWAFADLFTSPRVDGWAGNRGKMVVNRDRFLRLAKLAGFARFEVVTTVWFPEEETTREFFKLTR